MKGPTVTNADQQGTDDQGKRYTATAYVALPYVYFLTSGTPLAQEEAPAKRKLIADSLRSHATTVLNTARDEADQVLADAQTAADKLRSDAKTKADKLRSDATAEAQESFDLADEYTDTDTDEIDELINDVLALVYYLAAIIMIREMGKEFSKVPFWYLYGM